MNDYNALWRGQHIGRIWRHEYQNHPWTGFGSWYWYWQLERLEREIEAHAPTLESAMADFRRVRNLSPQSGEATARAKP